VNTTAILISLFHVNEDNYNEWLVVKNAHTFPIEIKLELKESLGSLKLPYDADAIKSTLVQIANSENPTYIF